MMRAKGLRGGWKGPAARGGGVTWNPTPAGEVAKPEPRLRAFVTADESFSQKEREFLAAALSPGRMFVTNYNLSLMKIPEGTINPPFPYLRIHEIWEFGWLPLSHAGAIALYAGEIRTEEIDHDGHHVRPIRHTFIIGGGRYIVPSLNWVRPITEGDS